MSWATYELDVINEIKNRLKNIKQSNGYHFDIKTVEDDRMEFFNEIECPAINFYFTSDDTLKNSAGRDNREYTLVIEALTKKYENTNNNLLKASLKEDVYIALNRKIDAPLKSDAHDARLNGLVNFISQPNAVPIDTGSNGLQVGCALRFQVNYTINIKDFGA
jgi:hypothetical protein